VNTEFKKNVRYLKGVGEVKARHLAKLEIFNVEDLLMHVPVRYEDRSKVRKISSIKNGETALVRGTVIGQSETKMRRGGRLVKVTLKDATGMLTLLGFNQPYLKDTLKDDVEVFVHGKYNRNFAGLETSSFTYEEVKSDSESSIHVGRIVPLYGLTAGLTQNWLRKIIYQTLENLGKELVEYLPGEILKREKICNINTAIKYVHFPSTMAEAAKARKRLILGEFLIFQTALGIRKYRAKKLKKDRSYEVKKNVLTPFKEKLKFEFTVGQKKVINEIFRDMTSPYPMKRLLQGDVGSGKTVVALSSILLAVENSYQGVVIAPTEILAEQHYMTFRSYLEGMGVKTVLLTGSMKKCFISDIVKKIAVRKAYIIVGTHALFQEGVDLSGAGVMVIDEQHRFGVRQKALLTGKSARTDVLAMSATPIPRTLAMCSYGDLDISTIRELPRNRKKPITEHLNEKQAYKCALDELGKGNLAYIVHPLIEESDKSEMKSARERFERLGQTVFKDYKCGLLHGRMSSDEKEEVMNKFARKEEVGINIPEATVMIIEDFNRYGLSSLHQLRGRIARSHRQPFCYLCGKVTTFESRKRLKVILSSHDGFKIAEEDLKLRGGGELFGTKQHGVINFKVGDPVYDIALLGKARDYAFDFVQDDVTLSKYKKLKAVVYEQFKDRFHLADVG
jgi:ATP-dependent DNA helicase RecG